MQSLVLLKRAQPLGIYVAEGESGGEVLSRLGYAEDPNVQVLAELPGLSPNQHQLCCILNKSTNVPKWRANVAKWYDCGPGAAFTALASLFEKKPAIRLWKADRELIQQMRIEARGLAKARELPMTDRLRIDALMDFCKLAARSANGNGDSDSKRLDAYKTIELTNSRYESMCCVMRNVQKQLQELTELTKTCAQQKDGGTLKLAATSSLCAGAVWPRGDTQETCETQAQRVAKPAKQLCEGSDGPEPNKPFECDKQQVQGEQPPAEANAPVDVAVADASQELAVAPIGSDTLATQASVLEGNQTSECLNDQRQPPATPWSHNARIESTYEDLSDLSSIDGYESPRHKQVKEYAKERRKAKAGFEPTRVASLGNEATLAACSKEDAETAASIRQQLQKTLGAEGAAHLLAQYQSKIMRDRFGRPQRFLVDSAGSLVGLVRQKSVALE